MKRNISIIILSVFICAGAHAQTSTNHLAPFAQKLVTDLKATHKDLFFIGLHVNPITGDTTNAIIASTIVEKVGNKSSAGDMEVINKGVLRLKTKESGKFYEVCLPIATASNIPVGMVVIQIEFKNAKSIVEALQKSLKIRDDLQKEIPTREELFSAV